MNKLEPYLENVERLTEIDKKNISGGNYWVEVVNNGVKEWILVIE